MNGSSHHAVFHAGEAAWQQQQQGLQQGLQRFPCKNTMIEPSVHMQATMLPNKYSFCSGQPSPVLQGMLSFRWKHASQ